MSTLEKFGQMFIAIGIFVALVAVVLFAVGRLGGRRGDKIVAGAFILPAVVMLLIGLVYPAINTLVQSFQGPNGGWISANKGLDPNLLKSPIDKLSVTILRDPKAVFRFDGSDQMPAAIGSDAFWKQATAWITGQSTKDTVDKIEAAWPKS